MRVEGVTEFLMFICIKGKDTGCLVEGRAVLVDELMGKGIN